MTTPQLLRSVAVAALATFGAIDIPTMIVAGIKANKAQVEALQARLLSSFADEELKHLGKSPEFIIALCAMLVTSLLDFTKGA